MYPYITSMNQYITSMYRYITSNTGNHMVMYTKLPVYIHILLVSNTGNISIHTGNIWIHTSNIWMHTSNIWILSVCIHILPVRIVIHTYTDTKSVINCASSAQCSKVYAPLDTAEV